jgi:small subunit ribosomal protein S1
LNRNSEKWLSKTFDYRQPRRGEIRQGLLLELSEAGAIVDVGLKHDGIIPRDDLRRLGTETVSKLEPGQEITAQVVSPRDQEGGVVLSLYQVQLEKDWAKAEALQQGGDIWKGQVIGCNRGGLLVKFGYLQGFVPASLLSTWDKQRTPADHQDLLYTYLGQELPLQVIKVNREARRLILSERLGQQRLREQRRAALLAEFEPGQVRRGVVRHLTHYGAFVDLGGIDGLIHISELAWRWLQHPSEVVQVGDEVDVFVLNVETERQRISLSLKQLQTDPWTVIQMIYTEGQRVVGTVSGVVSFGAFVTLDPGVDGLVHHSELADPPPDDPREFVERGDRLVLRILKIDAVRRRISLSLKDVEQNRAGHVVQLSNGR